MASWTKHQRQSSPGSKDRAMGCPAVSACPRAWRIGDESRHPTWPQVRQSRRWTQGESRRRHSSHPCGVLAVTGRTSERCGSGGMVIATSRVGQAGWALSASACSTHWRSTGADAAPAWRGDVRPRSRTSRVGTAWTTVRGCRRPGARRPWPWLVPPPAPGRGRGHTACGGCPDRRGLAATGPPAPRPRGPTGPAVGVSLPADAPSELRPRREVPGHVPTCRHLSPGRTRRR
jgi:hypothetical protein